MDILYDVVGYEGLYKINKNGEVWGCKRKKFMTIRYDKDGYKIVYVCKEGKGKIFRIHRLLAINFIPNPENLLFIDHIDRIKTNNDLENLRWCSQSTNERNKSVFKKNPTGFKNITTKQVKERNYYLIVFTEGQNKIYEKIFNIDKYSLEEVVAFRNAKYIEFGLEICD